MKVTKYPQSCLLIEMNGKRLLIDPGSFVSQKFKASDLQPIDGILITHEHGDHADPELLKSLTQDKKITVVGNQSTANLLGPTVNKVVADREEFELAGFTVTARELPHVDMVDGKPGPQNTGFVINGTFFHPGDGLNIEDLKVDSAGVPLAGPDVSPRDVYGFITQIGCKKVIPIHYDAFPADTAFYKNLFSGWYKLPIEFITLNDGQSTEL